MSDAHPGSHGPGGSGAGHEQSDADIGPILKFAVGLAGLIVFTMLLMGWLFDSFSARAAKADMAPSPMDALRQPPPLPRLEVSPPANLKLVRAAEDELLSSYGWIARPAGIVRIPIDRAMERLVEKGLPARSATPAPEGTGP